MTNSIDLARRLDASPDETDRLLQKSDLVVVRRADLEKAIDALTSPELQGPDAMSIVEGAETSAIEERAAYFDRTKGHFDREDAARSHRATIPEVMTAVRKALLDASRRAA